MTKYDSGTKRIFYEAYIQSFKGSSAALKGFFTKKSELYLLINSIINSIMKTKSNLKLRSSDSLNGQVITIIGNTSDIKVIEIGKEAIIDRIKSNWVLIETISATKDKNNEIINERLTGWVFGGYLQ